MQRLLGREAKPKVSKWLSADEAKPFFEASGVDMENIGFPYIKDRHSEGLMAYWTDFSGVSISLVKRDGRPQSVISGNYEARARASYPLNGVWQPGSVIRYSFVIDDNKLTLREKK